MLKQSSSRNQRLKGLKKIKFVLQTCLLLVISIWMLHQLKLFLNNKGTNRGISSFGRPENEQNEQEHFNLGRKSLFPQEKRDARKGKSREKERHSSSEIEEDLKRDESSGNEQETEDEETERIENLLDENSEEQEEALDSLESSFDPEINGATFEHRSLVKAEDLQEKKPR